MSIQTVHRQEYTDSTPTGVRRVCTDTITHTTQAGVYRQFRNISMETVHRQEYADCTPTGVCRQYTDRSIQTVHTQEYASVATPAEARERLALKGGDRVKF